ncbi:hypothetical protein WJX75_004172 [Coccomyxa subellipsoidea]|uniref:Uncharacterized protein n=1 Tax=Coccomyxa subellipsoidea TaxID=248742 RepID=A0ABR2Z010_9CHLO
MCLNREQQQQQGAGLPAGLLVSEKVKNKIGQEEYDKLRGVVLHHQETFVEQLYDLHRLVRRQQHLEANCRQRPAYNAELQRLEVAQQGSGEGAAGVEAAWQAQQETMAGTGRSTEPSTERKGSNTPGESSDVPAANGSRQHGHAQSQEQLQGLGVAASLLQQQHQNLEAAQAHATAAAIEVQRQQGLLAAAAQAQGSRLHHGSHHNLAAAAQAQAAQHQRTMEVAAESHMQHQQFMAAAAQAHLQHRQDMTAAAQARAQQQADLAEAQMAYGGSGGAGGSGGRRGTQGSGSGQNAAPSVGAAPVDASRMSFMQGAQQQHSSTGTNGMGNGGFQQGYNPMGMPGMMNGYGYGGYGNYGSFYPGFGGYSNMNGYNQYNPYSMAGAAGAMGFDPMQSWYMHHYGRGAAQATADADEVAAQGAAAAADAAADAQAAADEEAAHEEMEMDARAAQEQADNNGSAEPAPSAAVNAPRWWQDPAQVFGPEVLPDVVARMTSPARAANGNGNGASSASARHRGTSRPGSKHERQREEWEVAGMRVPPKQASKRAKTGSGNRHEATGQTTDNSMFGSGGSAFRKIPQRPRSVRSTGRTNSIGSENSKSSFGATAAAAQQATAGNESPPKQMESAANILVAFSGKSQPQH